MSNAMMTAGGGKDRGQYQYAGGIGGGNDGTQYVAFNAIPEGEYRSKGAAWAPEIRYARESVENYIVSADLSGITSKVIAANRSGVINSLTFAPVFVLGGSGARHSAYQNPTYCSGIGNGNVGGATFDKTLTLSKTGRYAIIVSGFVDSGTANKFVTIPRYGNLGPGGYGVWNLSAGTGLRIYHSCSASDWTMFGVSISVLL